MGANLEGAARPGRHGPSTSNERIDMLPSTPLFLAAALLLVPAKDDLIAQSHATDPGAPVKTGSPAPAWSIVPRLGFAGVRETGQWGSGGAEAGAALEYGGSVWRGGAAAAIRGVGVRCGDPCFIEGGPAVGLGADRSLGSVWIGSGVNFLRQSDDWHVLPFAGLSVDLARLRFEVRVELDAGDDGSAYVPIIVGVPIRLRTREP